MFFSVAKHVKIKQIKHFEKALKLINHVNDNHETELTQWFSVLEIRSQIKAALQGFNCFLDYDLG